jgi:hypothetical protein
MSLFPEEFKIEIGFSSVGSLIYPYNYVKIIVDLYALTVAFVKFPAKLKFRNSTARTASSGKPQKLPIEGKGGGVYRPAGNIARRQ